MVVFIFLYDYSNLNIFLKVLKLTTSMIFKLIKNTGQFYISTSVFFICTTNIKEYYSDTFHTVLQILDKIFC